MNFTKSTNSDNDETMATHISFLYNNLPPFESKSGGSLEEVFPDYRDEENDKSGNDFEKRPSSSRQGFRSPLKRVVKGFKNRMKKRSHEEDELLMMQDTSVKTKRHDYLVPPTRECANGAQIL